jgi:hypothetical protein
MILFYWLYKSKFIIDIVNSPDTALLTETCYSYFVISMNADSSVVSDMLIDIILTLTNVTTRLPSFDSLNPFVNFSLAHAVVAILKFHSCVLLLPLFLHSLWPQESDYSTLFFGVPYQRSSHVKNITVSSLLKRQWKASKRKRGKFILPKAPF